MASPAPIWQDPQCAFSIEWAPQKLDQVRIAVTDALYAVPRGGLEIGGVLLGNFDGKLLRIEDWVPMECEHLTGPSFVLSAKDQEVLKTQMAGMSRQFVGWFHSHTRSEILFSPLDLQLHETFFRQPWHIGMVLRPANMQPLRANYFFRNQNGVIVPGKSEFVVDVLRDGPAEQSLAKAPPVVPVPPPVAKPAARPTPLAAAVRPSIPQAKPVERPVVPAVAPPVVPSPAVPPLPVRLPSAFEPPSKRKPNFYVLAALLTIFGLMAAAYLTQSSWLPQQPEPLRLQASDVDGRLLIRWIPVRDAQTGKLHISDGTIQTDVDLDALQLAQGFYLYNRKAINETVQLKVGERAETTSFAGPLTLPSAGVPGSSKR